MHSKPLSESLSSALALAREKLFSFSSLSSRRTRPKSEHGACEKNRRSRETGRGVSPGGVENGDKRARRKRRMKKWQERLMVDNSSQKEDR